MSLTADDADDFTQLRPHSGGRISILMGSHTTRITIGDVDSHATASLGERELDELIKMLQVMRERSPFRHA